jgi:RND family efflux transporter MFP subunit
MKFFSHLWSFVLLLPIPLIAGCSRPAVATQEGMAKSAGASLERVVTGKPTKKVLRLETTQPGRIEAFEATPLHSKLAGYVESVLVDIGDRVTKDQLLVKLAIPELAIELRQKAAAMRQVEAAIEQSLANLRASEAALVAKRSQAEEAAAGVARADAQLARWTAELARIESLAANDSVTRRLVDETRNQFEAAKATQSEAAAKVQSARADVAHAEALVERARTDVSAVRVQFEAAGLDYERTAALVAYTEIKAPYDGIVTARNIDTRHFVQPAGAGAPPLVAVARIDKVRVFVDLPELEAGMLDRGDPAVVRVQSLGNREFPAEVTRDAWSLNESNRSLRVEIDLPNTDGALRPGMYATVMIRLATTEETLTLPTTAVLRDAEGAYCVTVNDGVVRKRRITTGLRSGAEIAIREGLEPGDVVVLVRGDGLADGQKVELVSSPAGT